METKQKTVTVEIPEGKMAVTERIKTIYDAQCELEQRAERGDSEARQLIKEYNSVNTSETRQVMPCLGESSSRSVNQAITNNQLRECKEKELFIPNATTKAGGVKAVSEDVSCAEAWGL